MSGNSTRKYRQLKRKYGELIKGPPRKWEPEEDWERSRDYFGDLEARDRYGITQLTALGAARGYDIIRNSCPSLGRAIETNPKKLEVEAPQKGALVFIGRR